MKLPKYEGTELQEATAQFAALQKEAEALVTSSQIRIAEIQVRGTAAGLLPRFRLASKWRRPAGLLALPVWLAAGTTCTDAWPISLPVVQTEIANIQKEKERIATTTIDDELAADPELAKVWRGSQSALGRHPGRPRPIAAVAPPVPAMTDALLCRQRGPCRRWTRRCRRTTSWWCEARRARHAPGDRQRSAACCFGWDGHALLSTTPRVDTGRQGCADKLQAADWGRPEARQSRLGTLRPTPVCVCV